MIDKLKRIVEKYPNNIAFDVEGKAITYKELWDLSNKYSQLLKKQGTSPVMIIGHKEPEMILSIMSCILSKRAYIPIELGTPINRIKEIYRLSNTGIILSNYKIETIKSITLEELDRYDNENIKENNNEIAYIIFTSGSTGNPKGVPISYNNLNNFINWISNMKPFSNYKAINILNTASYSFDLSVLDIYYSLCNGHSLVSYEFNVQEEYDKIFYIFNNKSINLGVMTPTFIKLCLLNKEFNSDNYPNLECLFFCGELLDKKTVLSIYDRFPNIKIINAYGPTEATCAVSMIEINKNMLEKDILPVGKINNAATLIEIENKEIVLKGDSVFNGYLSIKSDNFYKENGINCYKTGDLGYVIDNLLYCTGRKDNQIKYKGYRIELEEIENVIKSIDGVVDCVTISKKDNLGVVKTIKSYIVMDKKMSRDYINDYLNKYLPYYMIPKTIEIVDKLPINNNGKVDRKALL